MPPTRQLEHIVALNFSQTPVGIYNAIVVDMPLAAFFQDRTSEQDLDEMIIELSCNMV